jgi:integrase/recombinase XerD
MTEINNIAKRHQSLIQGWIRDMKLGDFPENTRRTYLSSVRAWLVHLDVISPQEAGREELKSYSAKLQDLKRMPSTRQNHFAAISNLFEYMIEKKLVEHNPVPGFQKRYMKRVNKRARSQKSSSKRQIISVQQAVSFIAGIGDIRDRLVNVLLAKTGVRREELAAVDIQDVDWVRQSITLKDIFPKRTNEVVYFDDETARLMKRWLRIRASRGAPEGNGPFFIGANGGRLGAKGGIYNIVTNNAEVAGLHDPDGEIRDRFTPHCWRHWFTTHLRRAGMPDNMIAELRGDSDARTLDIYHQVDHDELRRVYQARIPQLGL